MAAIIWGEKTEVELAAKHVQQAIRQLRSKLPPEIEDDDEEDADVAHAKLCLKMALDLLETLTPGGDGWPKGKADIVDLTIYRLMKA